LSDEEGVVYVEDDGYITATILDDASVLDDFIYEPGDF
jgi:hypothetical protein